MNGEAFEFAEPGLEDWLQKQEDLADEDEELDEYDVWNALDRYSESKGTILERVDRSFAVGPTSFRIWAGFRNATIKD